MIQKKPKAFSLSILFFLVLGLTGVSMTGNLQFRLRGPILASVALDRTSIVFEDVGAHHVWSLDSPGSDISIDSWSPTGCELLIRRDRKWAVVSIVDLSLRELPTASADHIVWSPDGESVTLTKGDDSQTLIYMLDIEDHHLKPLFYIDGPGNAIRWVSDTKLLYEKGGSPFIWDTSSNQSLPLGIDQSVWYWKPSIVHYAVTSPNLQMRAAYYSIYEYRAIHSRNDDDPSLGKLKDLADEAPRLPGMDILFFSDGTQRHVDIPSFLQFIEWSPSSRQIVAVSAPYDEPGNTPGVYIYNVEEDDSRKLENIPYLGTVEPSWFEPTWSPDEEWLAIAGTERGLVIYHLSDGGFVELDEQVNGVRLWWSPIMNYTETQCVIQTTPTFTSTPFE